VMCKNERTDSVYSFLDRFFSEIKKEELRVDPVSNRPYFKGQLGDRFLNNNEQAFLGDIFKFGNKMIEPQKIMGKTLEQELVCFRITGYLDKLEMAIQRARIAKSYCQTFQNIIYSYGKSSKGVSVAIPLTSAQYISLIKDCNPTNRDSIVNQSYVMAAYAEISALRSQLKSYNQILNCQDTVRLISKGFRYKRSFGGVLGALDVPGLDSLDLSTIPGGTPGLGAFGMGQFPGGMSSGGSPFGNIPMTGAFPPF